MVLQSTLTIFAKRIIGLTLFYPPLNPTVSKIEKCNTWSRPDLTLPKAITECLLFYPCVNARTRRLMSPGFVPDESITQLPPIYLCLCEHDMLCAEGLELGRRGAIGCNISVHVVSNAQHGWDKAPTPAETVATAYNQAIKLVQSWVTR